MRDDMAGGYTADHAMRGARIDEERDGTRLTSDHAGDEEKRMSENLRRCFGGDV